MKLALLRDRNHQQQTISDKSQGRDDRNKVQWSSDFEDQMYSHLHGGTNTIPIDDIDPTIPLSLDIGADLFGGHTTENINPDTLVKEKGMRIYDKMLDTDSGIKTNYNLKKMLRLSTPWQIQPLDTDDPLAVLQKEFVEWNFKNLVNSSGKSFDNFLWKILDCLRQGFKVAEIIWGVVKIGRWKGMICIKKLIVRNSRNYSFDVDKHGQLEPDGLVEHPTVFGMPEGGPADDVRRLPVNKFVIMSWDTLDDDGTSLYGRSEFRTAHRYYDSNRVIQKIWNRCIETFQKPPILIKFPGGAYSFDQQKKITADVSRLYDRQATGIPGDVNHNLIESERRSQEFLDALHYNDIQIARAMGVGPLLMSSGGTRGGTFQTIKKQFEMFSLNMDCLGLGLSEVIESQLIRRLIDLNFRNPLYPRYCMPSILKADQENLVKVMSTLIKSGVVGSEEDWIREFVGLPAQALGISAPDPDSINLPSGGTTPGVGSPTGNDGDSQRLDNGG